LLTALHYPKFKLDDLMRYDALDEYLPYAEQFVLPNPLPPLPVNCRDPKDEPFIHLAIVAKAGYLVTGDKDLVVLQNGLPFQIVTIADFLAAVR
jgi:putative PIN family toxin of toxin-antitoxin system